jgi:hypothetical protein
VIKAVAGRLVFTLRATESRYFRDNKGLDVALPQLAGDSAPSHDYVLVCDEVLVGDQLRVFGFGDKMYKGGKPAPFSFEGFSRREHDSPLALGRARDPGWPGIRRQPRR